MVRTVLSADRPTAPNGTTRRVVRRAVPVDCKRQGMECLEVGLRVSETQWWCKALSVGSKLALRKRINEMHHRLLSSSQCAGFLQIISFSRQYGN